MARTTLALSALYLAAVGVGLMFFPREFGVGAVPADASPELIALLRLLGGPFMGIAVLNGLSRTVNAATLRHVLLANLVGFSAVTLNDLWSVANGEAREIARVFLVVHASFAVAFAWLLRIHRAR